MFNLLESKRSEAQQCKEEQLWTPVVPKQIPRPLEQLDWTRLDWAGLAMIQNSVM